MFLTASLAAVPWWTAGFVIITVLDVAVWIFALCMLRPSRRTTILKVISLCWLMLPLAALCVFAVHDLMIRRIDFSAMAFEQARQSAAAAPYTPMQPLWRIDSSMIGWSATYGYIGFGLLALLAVQWMPWDRFGKRWGVVLGLVPMAYFFCAGLMLSS